jgi:lipid-A-disaccharide synthase-like uncharacterized protein
MFVPAVALIQRTSLFIIVALLGILFIMASLWLTTHSERRRAQASQ